jgi:secreted trypsin-like serine protease
MNSQKIFTAINFCFLSILLLIAFAASSVAENKQGMRVIGGGSANPSSYSVARLLTSDGNLCSGAVISSTAILTAGHCAFIGSRKGVARIRGKNYNLKSGRRHSSLDVGIVYTTSKISASRYQVPSGIVPNIGQKFLLLGFGQPNAGQLSYGYMQVSQYSSGYTEFLADAVGGSNACPGDSGGPAIVRYQNRDTIIGVVSRGPAGCRSGNQVIFPLTTNSSMARWIRSNS